MPLDSEATSLPTELWCPAYLSCVSISLCIETICVIRANIINTCLIKHLIKHNFVPYNVVPGLKYTPEFGMPADRIQSSRKKRYFTL